MTHERVRDALARRARPAHRVVPRHPRPPGRATSSTPACTRPGRFTGSRGFDGVAIVTFESMDDFEAMIADPAYEPVREDEQRFLDLDGTVIVVADEPRVVRSGDAARGPARRDHRRGARHRPGDGCPLRRRRARRSPSSTSTPRPPRHHRSRARRRSPSPPTSATPTPPPPQSTPPPSTSVAHRLFNNAGQGMAKRLHDHTEADWQRLVAVNLVGTWAAIRAARPPPAGRRAAAASSTWRARPASARPAARAPTARPRPASSRSPRRRRSSTPRRSA